MVWIIGLFPHLKVFTELPDSKATAPTPTLLPITTYTQLLSGTIQAWLGTN